MVRSLMAYQLSRGRAILGHSEPGVKRPDVVTLIPWQRNHLIASDVTVVTVVHTLADSFVGSIALSAGSIAKWLLRGKLPNT